MDVQGWRRSRGPGAREADDLVAARLEAALVAFADLVDREALAVLSRAPTPEMRARLTVSQLTATLTRGGRRRNLERRAAEIHVGLHGGQLAAPSVLAQAFAATATAAVGIISELNRQIAELEAALQDRFEQHPDADIYLSLPGLDDVLGGGREVLGLAVGDSEKQAIAEVTIGAG